MFSYAVYCQNPGELLNGQILPWKERYREGENVTFSCSTGYSLRGSATTSCLNMTWTHDLPECFGMLIYFSPQLLLSMPIVCSTKLGKPGAILCSCCARPFALHITIVYFCLRRVRAHMSCSMCCKFGWPVKNLATKH